MVLKFSSSHLQTTTDASPGRKGQMKLPDQPLPNCSLLQLILRERYKRRPDRDHLRWDQLSPPSRIRVMKGHTRRVLASQGASAPGRRSTSAHALAMPCETGSVLIQVFVSVLFEQTRVKQLRRRPSPMQSQKLVGS